MVDGRSVENKNKKIIIEPMKKNSCGGGTAL
jgi:hypothetical protein